MIFVCIAYVILLNGKSRGEDIAVPGTATFLLDLEKKHLCRRKRQAGVDFVYGGKVLSLYHGRLWWYRND